VATAVALGLALLAPDAGTAGAASAAPPPATTGELTISAIQDASVDPLHPNQVDASAPDLLVGDAATDRHVAYLKFVVTGLPAQAQVTTVGLLVHASSSTPRAVTLQVRSTTTSWNQTSLTFANAPTLGPVQGEAHAVMGADTRVDIDSVVSGNATIALGLRLAAASPASLTLAASEAGAVLAPRLVITYRSVSPSGCADLRAVGPVCGVLMGTTVNRSSGEATQSAALADIEQKWTRDVAVVHTYHVDAQVFPTPEEIAWTTDPDRPRLLATNWKPDTRQTWAAIARGAADARIDATAARLVAYGRPLLLAIQHEPEDNVKDVAGSGYTPEDYVAMFRHVVQRLRQDGVTKAAFVWDVMGYRGWGAQGYYQRLYPGDDVVDWIAADPYGDDLAHMLTRSGPGWPGWYAWATTTHPGKPLALFEFGMQNPRMSKADEAIAYDDFAAQAQTFPALHLALHFNHAPDGVTQQSCRYDDDPATLAAFQNMVTDAYLFASVTTSPMF
jgi:hypothetical protein